MNTDAPGGTQPAEGQECQCGCERCLITYLGKVDRALLPKIRIPCYRRCEPCKLKHDIILRRPATTEIKDEVRKPYTPVNGVSMGGGQNKQHNPAVIETEAGATSLASGNSFSVEKPNPRQEEFITPEAEEKRETGAIGADSEAAVGNGETPGREGLAGEDSVEVEPKESAIGQTPTVTAPENSTIQPNVTDCELVETADTASQVSPESPVASRVSRILSCDVRLLPFKVTTLDLDSGLVSVAEPSDNEMAPDSRRSSPRSNQPASPGKTVTIRAKICGNRGFVACKTSKTAVPTTAATKSAGKPGNYCQVDTARKAPGRQAAPETSAYRRPPKTSVYSPKAPPAKIKSNSYESMSSRSVEDFLSKSSFTSSRRSIGLSSQNFCRTATSNASRMSSIESRPPWYPLRSPSRGERDEIPGPKVGAPAPRQHKLTKAKSTISSKSKASTAGRPGNERVADLCDARSPKQEKRKQSLSASSRGAYKNGRDFLEMGERVYCTFRGVMHPLNNRKARPSAFVGNVARGTARASTTSRSMSYVPATNLHDCSDDQCEECVSESDATCYASDGQSSDCSSCECVKVSGCGNRGCGQEREQETDICSCCAANQQQVGSTHCTCPNVISRNCYYAGASGRTARPRGGSPWQAADNCNCCTVALDGARCNTSVPRYARPCEYLSGPGVMVQRRAVPVAGNRSVLTYQYANH
ncbi:uncharacterized protein BcabD6B2_09400 [Babesia caballi]|uniref:Uncharacterized protein n=1 Tax=Babesia caballi TaxID=5871 RepID=A0AAV4LNY2_BABCB|nr:hypothetical protein, conserved [Babesia caballi]